MLISTYCLELTRHSYNIIALDLYSVLKVSFTGQPFVSIYLSGAPFNGNIDSAAVLIRIVSEADVLVQSSIQSHTSIAVALPAQQPNDIVSTARSGRTSPLVLQLSLLRTALSKY